VRPAANPAGACDRKLRNRRKNVGPTLALLRCRLSISRAASANGSANTCKRPCSRTLRPPGGLRCKRLSGASAYPSSRPSARHRLEAGGFVSCGRACASIVTMASSIIVLEGVAGGVAGGGRSCAAAGATRQRGGYLKRTSGTSVSVCACIGGDGRCPGAREVARPLTTNYPMTRPRSVSND